MTVTECISMNNIKNILEHLKSDQKGMQSGMKDMKTSQEDMEAGLTEKNQKLKRPID